MTVSSILPNSITNAASAATAKSTNTAATTGTAPATSSNAATLTNPSSTLNQQDFLQLLVAQIQYQDPMNPQSDTDMAAQLAQFTSLQQATQSSASLAMMQANGLVGSTVTVQVDANNSANGVVTGVVLSNGTPQITVGGANYSLSQITSITPAAAGTTGGSTGGTTTPSTQTTP
jgi:flagellar basal-body rod modification protein FlgD